MRCPKCGSEWIITYPISGKWIRHNQGCTASNIITTPSGYLESLIDENLDYQGVVDGGGKKESQQILKTQYQLFDPTFFHGVSEVLTHGAKKYAKNNWMRGISWTDVFRAILHHLFDWFRGEDIDPDSGLPHLDHAACELMFLAYYVRNRQQYQAYDDRVYLDKLGERQDGTV